VGEPVRRGMTTHTRVRQVVATIAQLLVVLSVVAVMPTMTLAQFAATCTASVLNRTVPIDPVTGAFEIPNLPVTGTFGRVRVTCTDGAVTLAGQSPFFEPIANGTAVVGAIPLGVLEPPPTAIRLAGDRTTVSPGGTAQLMVVGTFPVALGSGGLAVLLGQGDGTVGAEPRVEVGGTALAIGDLNGDGAPDLVIASEFGGPSFDGEILVLLGDGQGGFGGPQALATPGSPVGVALRDLDGDGALDLVTANFFGDEVSLRFNGDGFLDLVTADEDGGTVTVWLGIGDGTFETPERYAAGGLPQAVGVADLNGDGRSDLVVGSGSPNEVSVLPHR